MSKAPDGKRLHSATYSTIIKHIIKIKQKKEEDLLDKVRYMISDAASLVNVEAHVLRYWEEELELNIPRNEMGHRYYTKENIQQFLKIKDLKEQGYQLKAIKDRKSVV